MKLKINFSHLIVKIHSISLLTFLLSLLNCFLFGQTLKKYDYKNFVVNEEKYFAIPFCYLGRHDNNSLELINYIKLYNSSFMVPMAAPAFDLTEILNYNEYFNLNNIWFLDNIISSFSSSPRFCVPSKDYKLWASQFIDFIKSNNPNIAPELPYIVKIGNTDKHVSLYPPNRIQVPVSKAIQRGIKPYNKNMPMYDFFIIKCKVNYIRQDSINIFMPVIAPKRPDIRKNLYFMSNYFYIPFNIAGKSRLDQMMAFYRLKYEGYSFESLLKVYKNKRDAYKSYKNAYKGRIPGYLNISTKYNFKHQLKHRIKYSYNEIDFDNIKIYHSDRELKLLLKAANTCRKNNVNIFAPQTVMENFIISIIEFSIPEEHEIIKFISQYE